jgi:Zn-dependent protease/predicted transcriptional regulator
MFGKSIKLFKLFGFEVKIDLSWILIAVLIAWSLAIGYFPLQYKNLSTQTYWLMGVVGALGLFASIIFHEVSHSLVARKFGIPMKGITLFIFGGVSEMGEEPTDAKAEFWMAIMGPFSSIFLSLVFYWVYRQGLGSGWPSPVYGIFHYLGWLNGLLAIFNLLPAFPLDGGRVLRAILWSLKKNFRWATRVSSGVGSTFGFLMILWGLINVVIWGNFIGGIWWFLIGMFLRSSAKMSYQQLVIRKALEGEVVRRFMVSDPMTVKPSTTINQLVEDYIYKYHMKMFPVVDADKLVGCVSTKQVQEISRDEWDRKTVRELATQCSTENTIGPQADAMEALSKMSRSGQSRLIVVEGNHAVGMITLKDMLKFLSLKVELGEK